MANGLVTEEPKNISADVTLEKSQGENGEEALATVRLDPPDAADDAYWLTAISWQAEEPLVNDPLEEVSPGVYRSTEPLPIDGNAKVLVRLHKDRALLGLPMRANEDTAIPAPAIEAPASFTRDFADEKEFLQRELKDDVPGWLWPAASLLVLALSLGFVLSLAWGLGRVGAERNRILTTAAAVGARCPRQRADALTGSELTPAAATNSSAECSTRRSRDTSSSPPSHAISVSATPPTSSCAVSSASVAVTAEGP